MKPVIIGVIALLSLSSAQAASPTRNDLIVTTGAVRYTLSGGHASLNMLDTTSRELFTHNLKLDDPAVAALWGRVMTGAVQIRHENGEEADTLWFNPLFDAGIIAHWTRSDGQWKAQAVQPVTGAALRGESAPVRPHDLAWLKAGPDMGKALGASAQATFAAAEKTDWKPLYSAPRNDAPLIRAYEGNARLYQMVSTRGYEGALGLVDTLMISGNPAALKLPVAMQRGLTAYGDDARRTLSPVSAYHRRDGWTLAMQSPQAPQVVWLIHFADPKGGAPAMPRGFVVVGQGPAQNPAIPGPAKPASDSKEIAQ